MGSIARAVTSVAQPVSGGSTNFPTSGFGSGIGQAFQQLINQGALTPVDKKPGFTPPSRPSLVEDFYKSSFYDPRAMGTAALVPVTLPTGEKFTFSGGADSSGFQEYIKSLGYSTNRGDGGGYNVIAPTPTVPTPIRRFNAVVDPRLSRTMSRPMFRPSRYNGSINQLLERLGIGSYATGGRVNYQIGGPTKTPPKYIPLNMESVAKKLFGTTNLDNLTYNEKQAIMNYIEDNRSKKYNGGIMNLRMGGMPVEMDLRAKGGFVPIGKKERADDVPARLSKNEFVFTAKAVRNAGRGNIREGAKKMYNLMNRLEAKR